MKKTLLLLAPLLLTSAAFAQAKGELEIFSW